MKYCQLVLGVLLLAIPAHAVNNDFAKKSLDIKTTILHAGAKLIVASITLCLIDTKGSALGRTYSLVSKLSLLKKTSILILIQMIILAPSTLDTASQL